jgi:hypothetical protein
MTPTKKLISKPKRIHVETEVLYRMEGVASITAL